jgi:radical SAM superfamily enzyme YgiQ (UPF0313 family)
MRREMYFIEAKSPGLHVFSKFPIPRLGTVLLGSILKERGYNSRVFIEDIAPPDWKAFQDVPIVGISSITSTAPRAYRLADEFRAQGKLVLMGGPHPTFLPDEALKHSDFVLRGEAEDSLVELLDALENGTGLDGIRGLSYKIPGSAGYTAVHNPPRDFITDLDSYPIPDFSLVHGFNRKFILPIATSRGCPFDCRFCSVIHMFGRRYRHKSIGRVMRELEQADGRSFIFFIDDNFTADKTRTKALLREMIFSGKKFQWSAQVRSDAATDEELLRLMRDAGCSNVFIGFESINAETLLHYKKKQGIRDIIQAIKAFREHRIRVHGMFVFGSDSDDIKTIRDTGKFARKMGMESVQLLILTPLPGTQVYDEMVKDDRLLHRNWERYDAQHAVFRPSLMTPAELQLETNTAMAKFYSWDAIFSYIANFKFYEGILNFYGKRAVRKAAVDCKEYIKEIGGL